MIKYSCHHPKQIYQLSSELLIHESMVKNPVETNGEICCPKFQQYISNIRNIYSTISSLCHNNFIYTEKDTTSILTHILYTSRPTNIQT